MTTVPAPWREYGPALEEVEALALSAAAPARGSGRAAGATGTGPGRPVARPVRVMAAVVVLGLVITGALAWTSWSLNHQSEDRLLTLQAQQAGVVVGAALPSTEAPLTTALEVASASNGERAEFTRYMSAYVGAGKELTSASLWRQSGASRRLVAVIGAGGFATSAQVQASLARAAQAPGLIVGELRRGQLEHLGYALALRGSSGNFAVYAEHALPVDRKAAVATNSAFSELDYAIYLGRSQSPADLLATSFSRLAPRAPRATVTVPFGNTVLTLVAAPRGPLDGTLPRLLPWLTGALGAVLSAAAAWAAGGLVRRRRSAERDAIQIRELYGQLGTLFDEQRAIAVTLQRALLPRTIPDIPGMEFAVRYVPGAKGMDIGGDWYSVIDLDGEHFVIVLGDVSGRGLSAASVMAEVHFTIRAYALEGNSPSTILEKCAAQLDVADGHFATVLVGLVDVKAHELTLANAGHFNPLLIDAQGTRFIKTPVGVPLGITSGAYEPVTVSLSPRSTVIAFTDGLVERRAESLEVGLARLEQAARTKHGRLDDVLSQVISELTGDAFEDDIAVLGLRWKT